MYIFLFQRFLGEESGLHDDWDFRKESFSQNLVDTDGSQIKNWSCGFTYYYLVYVECF